MAHSPSWLAAGIERANRPKVARANHDRWSRPCREVVIPTDSRRKHSESNSTRIGKYALVWGPRGAGSCPVSRSDGWQHTCGPQAAPCT